MEVHNSVKTMVSLSILILIFHLFFINTVNAQDGIVETFTTESPARLTDVGVIKVRKVAISKELNIDTSANFSEIISLPQLDYEKLIKEDNQNQGYQKALRVGVHRPIDQTFEQKWRIFPRSDGKYSWRVVIYSPSASFIRPHFKKLPLAGSEVYLYGKDGIDSLEEPVSKKPNVYKGTEFWGPVIKGDYLYIEVVQSSNTEIPDLYIDTISHGYRDPLAGDINDSTLRNSSHSSNATALCELDISCYSTWAPYGQGVAAMHFEKNSNSYTCTGSLIMDLRATFSNWFLTANHCISDNTTANTVITYFNYKTTYCNSPYLPILLPVYGAMFKVGNSTSDFSLLELSSNPPSGTSYLGWTTSDISSGAAVTGIHHPRDSYQRISFGNGNSMPYNFESEGISYQGINFWGVLWRFGTVEPGSSGSPLLNSNGQIFGQLLGGNPSGTCSNKDVAFYGKFGASWTAGLKDYLISSPVYRFASDHDHFFTISEGEKNSIMQNLPNYHYEGIAFYAYPSQLSGTSPVYRFVSDHDHFFTISEGEKNSIMQNLPNYHYEGIAFYAYSAQVSGTSPVYRFASDHDHFFTISEGEKNSIIQNLPNYHYEGVAFYAYPTQ